MGIHIPGLYEELKALDCLMAKGAMPAAKLREHINEDLTSLTEVRRMMTRCYCSWLLTLSPASFYEMMSRMRDAKLVEQWIEEIPLEGITLQQQWYRATEQGRRHRENQTLLNVEPDLKVGWAWGSA